MRQYDVCRNAGRGASRSPYLIVIQRDLVDALPTRLVAPALRLTPSEVVGRVMVPVEIAGEDLVISLPELFSIDRSMLGAHAGNVDHLHDKIIRALDMLITG